MELTSAQQQAIEYSGRNLQLIACAGSGKTEVVARRVAHLLTKPGVDRLEPCNIVAFTFTEKAAAELKERIVRRTREAKGRDITGMSRMYVGTIHGFCRELLTTEVPEFLKFETLDEARRHIYINRYRDEVGFSQLRHLDGRRPNERFWFGDYIKAISRMRESDIGDVSILEQTSAYRSMVQFRQKIRTDAYMDFDEQLLLAVEVLEQDRQIYERLSVRIKCLVVDEYQDINPVQERLVRLIHDGGASLCVVGDDDQTIYQWRGSYVGNIMQFTERYPDVHQIRLIDNYRSSEAIVALASGIVENIPNRLPKIMQHAGVQNHELEDLTAVEFDDADDEAEYIASTIKSFYGVRFNDGGQERGITWSDIAVLVRAGRHPGGLIANALKKSGIPFTEKGLAYLHDSPEWQATLDLFHYVAGKFGNVNVNSEPVSKEKLLASWSNPRFAVSQQCLATALSYADQISASSPGVQEAFRKFIGLLQLDEWAMPGESSVDTMYNFGSISKSIADWECINFWAPADESFAQFAGFLAYESRSYYTVGERKYDHTAQDAVTICTIHRSKGCEWPVVFIPSLTDGIFPIPQWRDFAWDVIPKGAIVGASRYDNSIENEDRLFYVAMTRSRKFLHFTWSPAFDNNGNPLNSASKYWQYVADSKWVLRTSLNYANHPKMGPPVKPQVSDIELSFTHLRHLLECPYQYKLKVLYGFESPLAGAMGFGKAIHNALSEVHNRFAVGETVSDDQVQDLVANHLLLRYADDETKQAMTSKAHRIIADYISDNLDELPSVQFTEQPVNIHLEDGISIKGRIDLVRRADDGSVTIVDLKSSARAQDEEITLTQLHTYVLGYKELTGNDADFVEIYELDERHRKTQRVNEQLISDIRNRTLAAVDRLRKLDLSPQPEREKCRRCDVSSLCPASLA